MSNEINNNQANNKVAVAEKKANEDDNAENADKLDLNMLDMKP